MKFSSLIAAIIAGVVGIVIWMVFVAATRTEIVFALLVIGVAVGKASSMAGGRGAANGLACAVIAVLAMCGAKYMGYKQVIDQLGAKVGTHVLTMSEYQEAVDEARVFVALESEDEYTSFMVEHNYTLISDAAAVSEADLTEFKSETADRLRRLATDRPSFETWREEETRRVMGAVLPDNLVLDKVIESIGAAEIIALILGMIGAFKFGSVEE